MVVGVGAHRPSSEIDTGSALPRGNAMTFNIRVGTILMKDRPLVSKLLGLELEVYSQKWSVIRALNGFSLDRKVRAAGWNSFFMAGTITASALGSLKEISVRSALGRLFSLVGVHEY